MSLAHHCSPAKAGAQRHPRKDWVPAFAGKQACGVAAAS
jgi:hypothetical protein